MSRRIRSMLRPFRWCIMFSLRRLKRPILFIIDLIVKALPEEHWINIRVNNQIIKRTAYEKCTINMHVDSHIERELRWCEAEKEPETVEWIEQYVKPGDCFYDVGANVGSFSLIAHGVLDGNVRIYAFEPGFMNYPQLCRNIQLNNADAHIFPFQVALSNQTGPAIFHYNALESGSALHALGEPLDIYGERFEPACSLPVLGYRLDDFIEQFALTPPTHMKIDVDGTEYFLLQGAKQALRSPDMQSLLLEVCDQCEHMDAIKSLLAECGFVVQWRKASNYLYTKTD